MRQPVDWFWLFLKPRGRLTRLPYFLAFLFLSLMTAAIIYQYVAIYGPDKNVLYREQTMEDVMRVMFETTPGLAGVIQFVFLVTFWPLIALAAKRAQDMGLSPFIGALVAIPGIATIAHAIFCLFPGTNGPNKYGAIRNAPPM